MKKIILLLLLLSVNFTALSENIYDKVGKQLLAKDDIFKGRFPLYTVDGKWIFDTKPNWFSGFTSGELWNMFDITGNTEYKRRALVHADSLIKYSTLDNTHDLGFIFFNSCVQAYKHTGIIKYREAAIQAARMLVKRFNGKGNFIRAWGKLGSGDRDGLMIIDTMMNLELLFWAAQETGDYSFYEIAYKHAVVCMNEHVRQNYSSYHIVEFDPQSGSVIRKRTHQGDGDETTWARGQAWGIYGFAIAYKYTKDERFYKLSENMAEYFLKRLPSNLVPYWDLDLQGNDVIKDASASAIAASGLFLLSDFSRTKTKYLKYRALAAGFTDSLTAVTLFDKSSRKEEGILIHTVYNFARNYGRDESYPAGDFYYIECLRKQYDAARESEFIKAAPKRTEYQINNNWFYLEDAAESFNSLIHTTAEWEKINLPHTWNKSDALDQEPGYRRSISWYEKEIFIPGSVRDGKVILRFEGVNNKAEIYVNGIPAGGHKGGYVGFEIDITPFIKYDSLNLIRVKADNSYDREIVPSQKSDFVNFGGITRNVWMKIIPRTNLSRMFVTTPEVSAKGAKAAVRIFAENIKTNDHKLIVRIKDKNGKVVSEKKENIATGNLNDEIRMTLPEVKNPELWSPDNPYLYSIEASLMKGNAEVDMITDRIGFRWFEFKERGAFYLNGERMLLRGTHRHEELSGYGNALPDSLHRRDIQMIKEMGANFVRLAHYPQAQEIYRACDELGLLVWDENPWCRGGMGGQEWQENTKKIFKEMILQNFNHPSIVLWSIGNESDWLPDFSGGDTPDSLKAFSIELNRIAKELDPYRSTTTRKFPAAKDVVDVFSPSIWSGWYSDVYKNYEKALIKARDSYKRFFHAEFGGDSHPGRHTETPISGEGKVTTSGGDEPVNKYKSSSIANIGDWSESYIVDLFDWYLHVTENLDWFTGSAQWIFRDFTTPLRPENPIPYVNQKGLVDMNNVPKDAYYVFKSYWSKNPQFCYIESHTWLERSGAANEKKEVNVFSNCSQVELFVNGVSQGRLTRDTKKYPACGLNWQVAFNEGTNEIIACGYDGDKRTSEDMINITYTSKKSDKPEDLILTKERREDGLYVITATAVDKNGMTVTDLNTRVYFTSLGGGRILTDLGTPLGSSVIELANGKARILYEHVPFQKGIIEARSQEFKGTYIEITN